MLLLSEISNKTLRYFLIGIFFLLGCWNLYAQPNFKRICISRDGLDFILHWDIASDPCAKFQQIEIFARPNDGTAFSSIGIVTNPAQANFVHSSAASLMQNGSYKIEYSFLCDDQIFTSDTLYYINDQPKVTELDSVSYDPISGGIHIGWSANPYKDLFGYFIWESENGNNFIFDSTYTDLYYLDTRLDPTSKQLEYNITAFDSCIRQSEIKNSQAAPFLSGNTANCARDITLNWIPYKGRGNNNFEIYLSIDGQDYFIDTLLSGTENTYTFRIQSGETVNAFVRSYLDNGATSRSNPVQFKALDSFSIARNYISAVSWTAPNTYEIRGLYDNPVNFDSIYVFKHTELGPEYLVIDEIDNNPYPFKIQVLTDTLVNYFEQILVDRCGRYYNSNIAYTTVLKGTETSTDNYSISWNPPNYLDGGIEAVTITLGDEIANYSTWNIIEQDYTDSSYSTEILQQELNIRCFQIISEETDPNTFGISETVYSNPKCFIQAPSIYFPNVIAVRGINNIFKPVGLSIDNTKSRMQIYAMNGQRVYDGPLTEGWNGLDSNGNGYHTTVFLYLADVYFLTGEREQYSGNFTILY